MEATTLIRTKLHRPRVASDLFERPRLVGKLNLGLEARSRWVDYSKARDAMLA